MENSANLYTENLVRFIDALRQAGLNPGLSEAQDAARILQEISLDDREAVKAALSACLAKSLRERALFPQVFESFFIGLEAQQMRQSIRQSAVEKRASLIKKSAQELQFQNQPLDLPEELIEAYANMEDNDKQRLQDFLQKTSEGLRVGPNFKSVTEKLVKNKLRTVAAAQAGQAGENVVASDLLYKDISAISDEEVPRALLLIRALVKQINGRISRQYKRTSKRASLDFRRTIHSSLRTGGTPCKLSFKKRPRRKQRLILLFDVSGSMYRFSSFALQFIRGMTSVADQSETFIFSEGLERVLPQELADAESFEQRVTGSALWRKGTNLGTALAALLHSPYVPLTHSTVLLIFSDGRSVDLPLATENLKNISRRIRKVLWMNPINAREWRDSSFVSALRPYALLLDCSTLDNLAKACAQEII